MCAGEATKSNRDMQLPLGWYLSIPLYELFLDIGLSVITLSRWKAVQGHLEKVYAQYWESFYFFFLPLHINVTPFSSSKSSADFFYYYLQCQVLVISNQSRRQDLHSEEQYRRYEASSPAHSHQAHPTLALLLAPGPQWCRVQTLCPTRTCQSATLDTQDPSLKKRLQDHRQHQGTSASMSLIKKYGFHGYTGLSLWHFTYHIIQNPLIKLTGTTYVAECDYYPEYIFCLFT